MGTYGEKFLFLEQQAYQDLSELLVQWQKNQAIALDNKSLTILEYFTYHPIGSTYRCFKYLNTEKKTKISYKNVHKKIINLLRLGFIKKKGINSNEVNEFPRHGAIYYKLSYFGVFYALIKIKGKSFLNVNLDIVHNYRNFFLYRNILFPYIQYETIEKIETDTIRYALETYLHECAVVIQNMFNHLSSPLLASIVKTGGLIFTRNLVGESVVEDFAMGHPLSQLIYDESKNRKNYQTSELETKGNERMIRLSADNRILYFKLNTTKLAVYENNDNNLIFETDIDPESDKDLAKIVNSYTQITINELIESYFKEYYRYDIYVCVLKLLAGITALSRDFVDEGLIRQDLLLLKKDYNFMSTMLTVKTFIEENFSIFEALE